MAASRAKTVWVLGSGFSKSLGAPTLYELIGSKQEQLTQEVFPNLGKRDVVYHLFDKHKGSLWDHAETFLELIDQAMVPGSPQRSLMERLAGNSSYEIHRQTVTPTQQVTMDQLRYDAVMTVAAECSTHTHNADVRMERWVPYHEFRQMLGVQDTVITFNYDLVLECLTPGNNLQHTSFMRPNRPRPTDVATVLKLHGSVDWGMAKDGSVKVVNSLMDFKANDWMPLIATPGATKSTYCSSHLKPLWDEALNSLRTADTIVFIGYRFPPSDSEARSYLLRAIRENKQPYVSIHLVLGPKLNDPDIVRLQALLTHTLAAAGRHQAKPLDTKMPQLHLPNLYSITAQPLWAEDFLTVIQPDALFNREYPAAVQKSRQSQTL